MIARNEPHRHIPQTHMETKHTTGKIEIRRTHPTEKSLAFIHPVNGGTHSDHCTQEMAVFYLAEEGSRNGANAAHMVRCWNLHPQLLELVQIALNEQISLRPEFRNKWFVENAEEVIALATGKEASDV